MDDFHDDLEPKEDDYSFRTRLHGDNEDRHRERPEHAEVSSLRSRGQRAPRGRRNDAYPRDGVKKSYREQPKPLDREEWVHDRFQVDDGSNRRARNADSYRPVEDKLIVEDGYKVKLWNLHYSVTERELNSTFQRFGPVMTAQIVFDRQDRSTGIAFVTYAYLEDAQNAVAEADGTTSQGQLVRAQLVNTTTTAKPARNPFDSVVPPSRSLFDRIETPHGIRADRTQSPVRHSDVSKPPPAGIDRYVPGQGGHRGSVPRVQRNHSGSRNPTRRPGTRREAGGRGASARAKTKTKEELDAEMEEYFAKLGGGNREETAAAEGSGNGGLEDFEMDI
ncbi:RNA-binding domain-containing protein [Lepidopterella palustris CBS 459.81]|uniref:RNA-binding domain-containing protein n=1 Tax=Lepidopterella palustris CBS 459.81 TaxID=1314670 RepID=A0A8E2E9V9_9PEZI|nr:RNA-binding domain-containing protein [Lepidopterella palustris CBS 459.81]